jgi:hypothetical protein
MNSVTTLEKSDFKQSELYPDYDFFDLRIDIIRQIQSTYYGENLTSTEFTPYHPIGFNLGNGIFYDWNRNFSISVLELLNIDKNQDFTVYKEDYKTGKVLNKYVYENNTFKIFTSGILLNFNTNFSIYATDSLVIADLGLLSKYTIKKNENEFVVRTGLGNSEVIKQQKGWYVKLLFGQSDYLLIDNLILLQNSYSVENSGNEIKIFSGTNSNYLYPLISIVRNETEMYIYNGNYNGTKIYFEDNKIIVENNGKKLYSYYSENQM